MWALHQILKQADKHSTSYSTHEEINEVHRASDFVFRMSLNQKGFASILPVVFISPSKEIQLMQLHLMYFSLKS